MRAVDVGVGHDDDLLVAQILLEIVRAGAAAERLDEIGDLGVLRELVLAGGGDVEDLAAQRQHRLRAAIARLLGGAARAVALDDENLRSVGRRIRAVGELAGQAQFAHRRLARDVLFLPAAEALVGALDDEIQELVGLRRIGGEPVVERIADRLFDDALGFGGRETVLGLALEFRLAHEHRQHAGRARHDVIAVDRRGALFLADAGGVVLEAAQKRAERRPDSWVPPSGVGMVLQ